MFIFSITNLAVFLVQKYFSVLPDLGHFKILHCGREMTCTQVTISQCGKSILKVIGQIYTGNLEDKVVTLYNSF